MRCHRDLTQPEKRLAPPNLCASCFSFLLTMPPGPARPLLSSHTPFIRHSTPESMTKRAIALPCRLRRLVRQPFTHCWPVRRLLSSKSLLNAGLPVFPSYYVPGSSSFSRWCCMLAYSERIAASATYSAKKLANLFYFVLPELLSKRHDHRKLSA